MTVGVVQFRRALLEDFIDVMNKSVVAVTKKLTVDTFNGVTDETPVDTGRARASWAIGIGAPSDWVPPEVDPQVRRERARRGGSPAPIFGPPPRGEAQAAIGLITGKEVIFVTTNLVYMEALEHGHSKKKPLGMVRVTVATIETNMQAAIAEALG
jgi:hypothetical protein